jgi:hypothetical protein
MWGRGVLVDLRFVPVLEMRIAISPLLTHDAESLKKAVASELWPRI